MNLINQIILSAIMVLALESCGANNDKSKEEKFYFPLVEIASAERKPFTHEITAQGNVESAQDILLSAELGGLINKIKVKSTFIFMINHCNTFGNLGGRIYNTFKGWNW